MNNEFTLEILTKGKWKKYNSFKTTKEATNVAHFLHKYEKIETNKMRIKCPHSGFLGLKEVKTVDITEYKEN